MVRRLKLVSFILTISFFLILQYNPVHGQQRLPNVEVKMHKGRPTVFVDGMPKSLSGYNTFHRPAFQTSMPAFYKHDIAVYFIAPGSVRGDSRGNEFWRGDKLGGGLVQPGEDVFSIDEQAEHIIKGDPDAYIMVRYTPHPPDSWRKLHPAEYFITEEATVGSVPSLASEVFWQASARYSDALIRYCESRPWASRVIGYGNFHVTEGSHRPVIEGWLFDHSPLMVQRWREFLEKKYGTVERLRAAYNDTSIAFETINVPKDKLRGSLEFVSNLVYWQPAKANQPLRDYLELQRDLWHLRFREQSAAMHGAVNRKMVFLHDALKQTMLGWNLRGFFGHQPWQRQISWNFVYPEVMAGSGHMGIAALFGVPGCDGLITPHDYQARGAGGVYEPEGIVDSAVLHGDLFYSEMDTRNYLVRSDDIGGSRTPKEFASVIWRNFAGSFTRGFHSYLMEFGRDWYLDDASQKILGRQYEVINESINWQHETMPGIAMILDDSAVLETNGSGHYFNEAIMWEQKVGLARCGVPFRVYLYEDLMLDNFPKHRVYYFPNLFRVDDERLALLKKKVFTDGNVVVWGPGSGISDGKTIGTESATRLTGFSFTMLSVNSPRRIVLSDFSHPVISGLDAGMILGGPLPYGPVLIPEDGRELGMLWTKSGKPFTGISLKEFGKGAAKSTQGIQTFGEGDYASIFMTTVPLPASMWRNIARYAGAHVYSESGDVLLADKSIVGQHSLQVGKKRIALPGAFRVRDVVSGQLYSSSTDEIIYESDPPETRVFLLEE